MWTRVQLWIIAKRSRMEWAIFGQTVFFVGLLLFLASRAPVTIWTAISLCAILFWLYLYFMKMAEIEEHCRWCRDHDD